MIRQLQQVLLGIIVLLLESGCVRHFSLDDAVCNHILFEMSDPTLMENSSDDSLVFIGLVFDHSETADSLRIVASYLPPLWFTDTSYFIGTVKKSDLVYVYATDCPQDSIYVKKLWSSWIPDGIDTDYTHYKNYITNSRGGVEHYLINTSTYVLGRRNQLILERQGKVRWFRK